MKIKMFIFFLVFIFSIIIGISIFNATLNLHQATIWVVITSLLSFWLPEIIWRKLYGDKH